jgi:hypothetical protein
MGLGLLCRVRMLGTRVYLQLAQELAAEAIFGEHPPNRSLDHSLRVLFEAFSGSLGLE